MSFDDKTFKPLLFEIYSKSLLQDIDDTNVKLTKENLDNIKNYKIKPFKKYSSYLIIKYERKEKRRLFRKD